VVATATVATSKTATKKQPVKQAAAPADSKVEILRHPAGNSNGLAFDRQGRLLACQHDRRVTRTEKDGRVVTLAETYDGKKLNSPNDLTVHSDGSIYFTDPPYGIKKEQEEQGFSGIYRIRPDGTLQLLNKEMPRPNGLAFSPDEKRLYVNDSQDNVMRVFDVQPDGTLTNNRVLVDLKAQGLNGAADGMKVNVQGDIITTAPGGVAIVAPDGTIRARLLLPDTTTNVGWGDADWKTLYITASPTLYRVRMRVAGVQQGMGRAR
jgi:gluconolactonase